MFSISINNKNKLFRLFAYVINNKQFQVGYFR